MTTLTERELVFTFPAAWTSNQFDVPGTSWPKGISPIDFIIERADDILLIEVKDPSAAKAPDKERKRFVKKMMTDELTHQELVPKARSSWSYLRLMDRTSKPLRYIVVVGTEKLSMQPVLLQGLTDRLKKRLAHEADEPWVRPYIESCVVISALKLGDYLDGVTVSRKAAA